MLTPNPPLLLSIAEGIFKVGDIVRVTKTMDPEKRVANPP